MVAYRYVFGTAKNSGMPILFFPLIKRQMTKSLKIQGYGTHSKEESKLFI